MELEQVKEFLALAEERNYWRAAERLYMNQSTLSKHIKALEEALEGKLFFRTTRRVELTAYGRAFLPYARELVRVQGECSAALGRLRRRGETELLLYCIPELAQYGLAKELVEFHLSHPEVEMWVEETGSYRCREALERRECELALCWEPDPAVRPGMGRNLVSLPLAQDRLALMVVRESPLAGREKVALGELEGSRIGLLKGYPADLAREHCRRAGFVLRPACVSDAIHNILDVLPEEDHAALLPERLIRYAMEQAPAVEEGYALVEPEEEMGMTLSLSRRDGEGLSGAGGRFWRFFSERYGPGISC